MKKVLVLGVGAQGSAAALKLDQEPAIEEVVCADYDIQAVEHVVAKMKKGRGVQVDANNLDSIIEAAQGVDLIVNGLALPFAKNVLDAALAVKANYQDYAGTDQMYETWRESEYSKEYAAPDSIDEETMQWWESYMAMYKIYGEKFEKIGKLALFGTGSAPGLICAATRKTMEYLDTCDTIYNIVWEGVYAKRFQPFWWSPITALTDMRETAVVMKDGKLANTEPFSDPISRQYDYMDEPIIFREHCHDEPFMYSFNAEDYFKGCRNSYFKYAGAGMDFAKPLYEAGLLSMEEEEYDGKMISPFKYILSHVPHAPKYEEEILPFIEEGLLLDSGCMVIESYGQKDGKDILVEGHVSAPGFVESFERAKITAEMYLTGQSGYLFSKMFINGDFGDRSGLISTDMLSFEQVDRYFEYAEELGITLDVQVKEL